LKRGDGKMRKKTAGVLLVLTIILCGSLSAYATDIDYSEWDSGGIYPADVMGTKLLTPVKFLMDKKIITGDTDGLFHPERGITRAEFATMMARATNNTAELESAQNLNIFSDLEGYAWAKPFINAVTRAGLFKGRSADRFDPGANVTYAEVITVLIRINKGAADAAEGMATKWPNNYILYAQTYNLMGDVVVNDWNAPATRGDTAVLLYRSLPR